MIPPGKNKRSYEPLAQSYEEMAEANKAITRQKQQGLMLPASAYLCQSCGAQADDYHHPSYRPEDRLCVVPLCTKCHIRTHRHGLELPDLGVVPTALGVVRIAIADSSPS